MLGLENGAGNEKRGSSTGMVPGDMQAAGHQPPAQHGAGPLMISTLQQLRGADYCHLDFTGKKAEAER